MGIGGISVWQLLIILVIVMLLFGTKRLRNIGSDLGGALKGFRKGMSEGDGEAEKLEADPPESAESTEEQSRSSQS